MYLQSFNIVFPTSAVSSLHLNVIWSPMLIGFVPSKGSGENLFVCSNLINVPLYILEYCSSALETIHLHLGNFDSLGTKNLLVQASHSMVQMLVEMLPVIPMDASRG